MAANFLFDDPDARFCFDISFKDNEYYKNSIKLMIKEIHPGYNIYLSLLSLWN